MFKPKFAWVASIFTFALSVSVSSIFVPQPDLPIVEVDLANFQRDEKVILTGQIEIEPVTSKLQNDFKEATFKVTNLTTDTIHYQGYERNHNALVWIRQSGRIYDALDLPCWRGVETQSMEPSQEVLFSVPVPQNGKPFEVGFDFRVDTRMGWKTVWVKVKNSGQIASAMTRKTNSRH